jgi:diaminohydroxyphosphoribosylaminopyrimidine deaminase / 5-amino-6-(5-phosphoribosylamino)uracil reductase
MFSMKIFDPSLDAFFLRRCFDLARLGTGRVAPNPMVGAVLVFGGRIIGEGYHRQYGGAHAEVEALRSVKPADRPLIPQSVLYVSLEPCCIFGRTPPCTNLILDEGIPRVVVSNLDQTPEVNGAGIRILREAGVDVRTGLLETEGEPFSRIRNCFVSRNRPYILLKFARSADGYIGRENESVWLSDPVSRRLAHKWRSETGAILAGTQTVRVDDPALTNRYWHGPSPLRLVIDQNASLPHSRKVFDDSAPTWVFTSRPQAFAGMPETLRAIKAPFGEEFIPFLLHDLAEARVSSLMVEGGSKTLNAFIEGGWWDEASVFDTPVRLGSGIPAPLLPGVPAKRLRVCADELLIWRNETPKALNFL